MERSNLDRTGSRDAHLRGALALQVARAVREAGAARPDVAEAVIAALAPLLGGDLPPERAAARAPEAPAGG